MGFLSNHFSTVDRVAPWVVTVRTGVIWSIRIGFSLMFLLAFLANLLGHFLYFEVCANVCAFLVLGAGFVYGVVAVTMVIRFSIAFMFVVLVLGSLMFGGLITSLPAAIHGNSPECIFWAIPLVLYLSALGIWLCKIVDPIMQHSLSFPSPPLDEDCEVDEGYDNSEPPDPPI